MEHFSPPSGVDFAAWFGAIFDRAPFGILVHRAERPLYCNQAFADLHRLGDPAAVLRLPSIVDLPHGERWRLSDDVVSWAETRAWPVDVGGRPAILWCVRDISRDVARETRDAELRETLDRYSDAVLVTDAENRVLFSNRRYHALFDELPPPDALRGMAFAEILRRTLRTGLLEDAAARRDPEAYVTARLAERAALDGACRAIRLFRGRWLEIVDERIIGGAIVSRFTDIHDRKQAEDSLAEAQAASQSMAARLGAAIEALPVGFLMIDEEFNYLDWNQRYEDQGGEALTGLRLNLRTIMRRRAERGEYNGVRLDPDQFTPEHIAATPALATLLRCQAARGPDEPMSAAEIDAHIEWNMLLFGDAPRPDGLHWSKPRDDVKAGTNRIIETRVNRIARVGWVLIHTDVTEIRAAEAELRLAKETAERAVREIRAAQARLVQAEKLASLGQLVAGVAHEINTPIGVTVTAASKLATETAIIARLNQENRLRRADLAGFIEMATTVSAVLLSGAERAARLVRSFKLVAADRASDRRRRFDLGAYLTEILRSLGPMLNEAGIALTLDLAPCAEMDGFPGMLSHVIMNLVGNVVVHAYDAGVGGALRLAIRPAGAASVQIICRDEGRGIAADDLPRVFDPFFTTKRGAGDGANIGLGLHIVHNLVTGPLGGALEVESHPNQGSVFTVTLPLTAPG